jgi:alpha-glucosidase
MFAFAQSIDLGFFCTLVLQGLCGQPFAVPDIGGFAGNATPKLFARWMGIRSMMPFSRGHFEKATSD